MQGCLLISNGVQRWGSWWDVVLLHKGSGSSFFLGREFVTLCYAVSVCLSFFLIVSSFVRLFFVCLFLLQRLM